MNLGRSDESVELLFLVTDTMLLYDDVAGQAFKQHKAEVVD